MNHPECVITGIEFRDTQEGKSVRGDLHSIGDCYVLNANTTTGGNCAWRYGDVIPHGEMVVSAMQSTYFERRGVIVFTKAVATFNDVATEYMRPQRPPLSPVVGGRSPRGFEHS